MSRVSESYPYASSIKLSLHSRPFVCILENDLFQRIYKLDVQHGCSYKKRILVSNHIADEKKFQKRLKINESKPTRQTSVFERTEDVRRQGQEVAAEAEPY